MKISLVTGSLLREPELRRLLESLSVQEDVPYEIIVVEQREPDRAQKIVEESDVRFAQVEISAKGLSRARNVGIARTSGQIIGFPDDDCWYERDTLQKVEAFFLQNPEIDFCCALVQTPTGTMLPYPSSEVDIDRRNVWRTGVSPGIFIRAEVVSELGGFDEAIGVGAGTRAGSGEETDFLLRALSAGFRGKYEPIIRVWHPSPSEVPGRLGLQLGWRYGFGFAVVARRHGYSAVFRIRSVARPVFGTIISLTQGRFELARFRAAVAAGRACGFLSRPKAGR